MKKNNLERAVEICERLSHIDKQVAAWQSVVALSPKKVIFVDGLYSRELSCEKINLSELSESVVLEYKVELDDLAAEINKL